MADGHNHNHGNGHGHGHHHGCGGGGGHDHGACDHSASEDVGIKYSLFEKIDMSNLECLNESVERSVVNVFKPWDQRHNDKFVESDVDEELLFNIPFTGSVKVKSIIVIGPDEQSHPAKLRLFRSKDKMSFSEAEATADQEIELAKDPKGIVEYPLKMTKFSDVSHMTIHIPSNYGAETTRVDYIGLAGEWRQAHRHGVTITSYELAPNMADHPEVGSWNSASHQIS